VVLAAVTKMSRVHSPRASASSFHWKGFSFWNVASWAADQEAGSRQSPAA
jgi:hypothetical protein